MPDDGHGALIMEQIGSESRTNGHAPRVWLVDDDESICAVLERALRNGGMVPRAFDAAQPALDALSHESPDVLITGIRMRGHSALDLLRKVREVRPALPVIVMTAYSDLGSAVASYEAGAFEYLPKPFDLEHAVALARRAANTRPQSGGDIGATPRIPELLGHAPAMQRVFRAIGRLARSSVTVLITGESGTGKEVAARALHDHSPRAGKPFVTLNVSAIPGEHLESELFGLEQSTFTGTFVQRRGRFEQADGGTLFLDEIGDMSMQVQTRLLRVLTEGEFYRVAGVASVHVDVRVAAATSQNLQDLVLRGRFRQDLFHRLNVIRIEIPPLRARAEDIAELLDHYLKVAAHELAAEPKALAKAALERLLGYGWPGNVRELVNLCTRLSVLAPGSEIGLEDLPPELGGAVAEAVEGDWANALATWADKAAMNGDRPLLDAAVPKFERVLIRAALKRTQGHRREAAELLGWGRNTLTQKIRDLGMGRESVESAPAEQTQ
jgi:two-component system nitrogen regulation response regulator GlnG